MPPTINPQSLTRTLLRYREPNFSRALFEVAVTAVPLVLLWAAMWWSLRYSYWLTLLLAFPAAGFMLRLFMIQHDCGHGAFFRQSAANNVLVMFGIGPAYMFLLQHRLPFYQMRDGLRPWISTMATNAAIGLMLAGLIWLVGFGPFLAVHLPIMLLAASIGVWLFYVQHQFEDVMWARADGWAHHDAALKGSSYYDLPGPLRWLTANIGIHHVHHLNSRIPYYRLGEVMRDHPELKNVGRVTIWQSLGSVRLSLWCEKTGRLVSFKNRRS